MAVTSTIDSNSITIKLNGGTSASGTVKTINVNLTGIKKTAFTDEDKQKVLNIVDAISETLEYPVFSTQITTKAILEDDE